jgi:C-terminal processing protease CtpA/Prc
MHKPAVQVLRASAAACLLSAALGGCGRGGGGGGGGGGPAPPAGSSWVLGSFLPAATFAGRCVAPRSGTNPATQQPYTDVLGTTLDENNWLRSWSNDLYLWYSEIVDRDPGLYATPEYFNLLKTTATTPSGRPKDRFHFTYATTEWLNLVQSGVEAGYGAYWGVVAAQPPRNIVVAYTEPGSPARAPSVALQRGEQVIMVDGVDVVSVNTQAGVDVLVAGLYPDTVGEQHSFTLRHPVTSLTRTVNITSASVTKTPVLASNVLQTGSGPVGYILFNDHLATAEQQLISAIEQMRAANVNDLVLDLRYNGGGLLAIASQLAYMIAGPVPTANGGQTFERLTFNDKHQSINPVTGAPLTPVPFYTTTRGYSTTAGQPLPTLNLSRVYVLTGGTTCSASESIMNGLRGVNVNVFQIGSTTCGKPYGFYAADNCGTTYFSVQFKGVNAAGFGEYSDGFSPANTPGLPGTSVQGCSVADDFSVALGNVNENRLEAAHAYRLCQACPVPTGSKPSFTKPFTGEDGETSDAIVVKTPWLMNRSLEGI